MVYNFCICGIYFFVFVVFIFFVFVVFILLILTRSVEVIFSILLQHCISKPSRIPGLLSEMSSYASDIAFYYFLSKFNSNLLFKKNSNFCNAVLPGQFWI